MRRIYEDGYGSPDPRDFPAETKSSGFGGHRKPRGPKTFGRVTYPAVAAAAGITPDSVKKAQSEGRIDMHDLRSVSAFIEARVARAERRQARAERKRARGAKGSAR